MSERRRAALVYNPVKVELDALKAAVSRAEEAAGWDETLWLETSVEDPGAGQTREAIEAGVDMVIAAGGDGTVRVVAEALHGSGISLGLLPSGTGNLLARNLDLTLDDIDNALTVAFSGTDRAIDIGMIDIETDHGRDRHAYVDALRKALLDKNQLEFRYRLDG